MARRCTTVPGLGACCRAAQQGMLGRPFILSTSHGQRCAQCDVVGKRKGGQGFRFRFHKSAECGIGPGGCPYLAGGQGGNPTLPFGSPSGGGVAVLP